MYDLNLTWKAVRQSPREMCPDQMYFNCVFIQACVSAPLQRPGEVLELPRYEDLCGSVFLSGHMLIAIGMLHHCTMNISFVSLAILQKKVLGSNYKSF